MDEKEYLNPIDRNASDEEKVSQLRKLTSENKPLVEKLIGNVDSKYGTASRCNEKDPGRIIEKGHRPSLVERNPEHNIEHIRDSFRFKTVLKDIRDLPKIAGVLKVSGIEVIKKDTDKVLEPTAWGWRIAAFDLRMPNGQLVEYYCPVQEIEDAKNTRNHELFEKWRNRDYKTLTKEERIEEFKDKLESIERYEGAWQAYLRRTRQGPEQVKESLDRTHEILDRQREPNR
jgi:hypothetical protein